jgi:hypothetical protein
MGLISGDDLLYPVVDALEMTLHEMEGKFRGFETRRLQIGPWHVDADVSIVSDRLSDTTATFFVKVVGNLWLYLVSKKKLPLVIYVLDGSALKLHVKDVSTMGKLPVTDALKKLKNGLITAYVFNEKTKTYDEDPSYLDYKYTDQDTIRALPAPTAVPPTPD